MYGFNHILSIRSIVSLALFVCRVDNTKCPVSEALTAVVRVSESLISHTITISGSCLNIDFNQLSKVNHIFSLTSVCITHGISYSIGSSSVIIFLSLVFNLESIV
jgi:hypothetical protein